MTIEVWLRETSQPIIFKDVKNTYIKGWMYCIYHGDIVTKYPRDTIFKVEESYKKDGQ